MKNEPSFMSLVYREYCVTKKTAFGNVFTCMIVYGICIMFTLSTQYGNLSKVTDGWLTDTMSPVIRFYGIYFSFLLFMMSAEGSVADLKNKTWALYRKSSPVKPFRLALARVVYQVSAFAVSIGVSFTYLAIDSLISGENISAGDIGVLSAISVMIVLLGVAMTVCVEFLRSNDKGMLMATGILFAVIIPVSSKFKNDPGQTADDKIAQTLEMLGKIAPLLFAAIVILFALELVIMTQLYKRREK